MTTGTTTASRIVNINGEFVNEDEAMVPVFDRSFIYGDSLYEVIRTVARQPLDLDEHLSRLRRSAELCHMNLGQEQVSRYHREIRRSIDAYFKNHVGEAYVRLIVSRGSGQIGFDLSCIENALPFVIIVQDLPLFSDETVQKGIKLQVSRRIRNHPKALDPAAKSGNYLNNLLAFLEANAQEFDDAILCNHEGHLTEGTTFNIAYVKRGIVVTPPLSVGILDGITRRRLIQLTKQLEIPLREVRFPKERLYEADEVFVTGTVKEVLPVTKIDRKQIKDGRPGPITLRLRDAYTQWMQKIVLTQN